MVKGNTHEASPTVVGFLSSTFPAASTTTTVAAAPSCESSATARLASPAGPTSLGTAAMLVVGCLQFSRRSTRTDGSFVVTLTRQRIPRHVTVVMLAAVEAPPRSMMSSGTTHSCGLTPPWAYSLFRVKQAMPGGEAMRTWRFQYQP